MHDYVKGIVQVFSENADPTIANGMEKYMRNQFTMFGIKRPERNALQRAYFQHCGKPQLEDLPEISIDLWSIQQRECQYFAMDLLKRFQNQLPKDFINILTKLITQKSWWDTVDLLATIVGTHFLRFPELNPKIPDQWIEESNIWLQRTAILFQLKYKEKTDWAQLKKYILKVADNKEFFLQKASGWSLREYAKVAPQSVKAFISEVELPALTVREGSKYL